MCWAKWFYPWSSLFVTVPMEHKRGLSLSECHQAGPNLSREPRSETDSIEQDAASQDPQNQASSIVTERKGSAEVASSTRTSKLLPPLPYLPPISSTATRIRGASLTRLDTCMIRHTRSASVPNQPFISARPVSFGRNRSFTRGEQRSAEDKADRWYALSYHSPISPHPAPQTSLPPLPTEVGAPEQQQESRLEPLEESPVLPRHPYHGPASPRSLAQ
jgi:hypothetical protein